MDLSVTDFTIVVLAGGIVGWIAGLFGIGGGLLLVPVLNILLGIPVEWAVGSTACQILGPATTSLMARRIRLRDLELPLTLSGGLVVGVWAGTMTLRQLDLLGTIVLWEKEISAAQLVVLGLYFSVMAQVGLFSIWESHRAERGRPIALGWLADWRIPPLIRLREFEGDRISLLVLCWFGLGIGFLSGLLGMGGGLILIPGMVYLFGIRAQKAILIALIIIWMISFQATVIYAWNGFVDLKLVCALLLGGTFGAQLGSRTGQLWRGQKLRRRFGWLLLGTAAMIAFQFVRMVF
ncbi:MAG TPA: sulfite exporter TauE/SafE family protein [Planctomycetaceae bacterium]|nr:sulfite exporter TauE/SafE family protein [Planctomycetaceae bacterium]